MVNIQVVISIFFGSRFDFMQTPFERNQVHNPLEIREVTFDLSKHRNSQLYNLIRLPFLKLIHTHNCQLKNSKKLMNIIFKNMLSGTSLLREKKQKARIKQITKIYLAP